MVVGVTMALLAALVWALNPSEPKLKPAPLRPQPAGCVNRLPDFQPSNLTEVPELSLDKLDREARSRALLRLNLEPCSCGCNLSLAACRNAQPDCEASKEPARKISTEEKSAAPGK